MRLDPNDVIQIQSKIDQENAFLAEVCSCEEYADFLMSRIQNQIDIASQHFDDSDYVCDCGDKGCILDSLNILRFAQCKLAEILIGKETEDDG